MFRAEYKEKFSAARRTIRKLDSIISTRRVAVHDGGPRLVFLCGANKLSGDLSERRQSVINLINTNAPDTSVIIAEDFFEEFLRYEKKGNLLDLEYKLSDVADHIIIILEGDSAFCELGAFAHKSLRSKLIVINNKRFKETSSFINIGPIRAVKESQTKERSPILWYKMRSDGVDQVDGIGRVFPQLVDLIQPPKWRNAKRFSKQELDPSKTADKYRILFVHDLIFLAGPLTYRSLIDLIKILFGDQRYDVVKDAIALLVSLNFIIYESGDRLRSSHGKPFLKFYTDITKLRLDFSMIRLRNETRAV